MTDLEQIIKELVEYLNHATKLYDEGIPEISDEEWDNKYFELASLERKTGLYLSNSPTQRIDYQVVSKLNKITHEHQMLSLQKSKEVAEIESFLGSKNWIALSKMDGLTCSLTYENGRLVRAETRGNGSVGEDILHNALVIPSIPKKLPVKERVVIDGEIICTYDDFKPFANDFKNPRNFAAGSIRLLDSQECAKRHLTFVAWDVLEPFQNVENTLMMQLGIAEKYGFYIPAIEDSINFISVEKAIEYIKEGSQKRSYPIDGVVFKFNDLNLRDTLGYTAHHFNNAIAFKFYDETYPSKMLNIEWTMGRTGTLTPVAVFEPIDIDGSTVERASLHNLSVMTELMGNPYVGQSIEVFKANMIIPQISWADLDNSSVKEDQLIHLPKVCPICGQSVEIRESDAGIKNIVCENPNCEGKLINRLDHFCGKKGLDIKGLSKATLGKLIDWGWINNLADIFELKNHKSEWMRQSGFGERSVQNILDAIEAAKSPTLDKFISSLGIPLIGNTVSKELIKHIKTYEEFRDKAKSHFNFSDYDGFADSKTLAIWHYNFSEADKIYLYLNIPPVEEEEKTANSLEGITVVITGKLSHYKNRAELQHEIEKVGGKVVSSVSKNTNYLINNDNTSTSTKNLTAKKLNVPILTEEEFIERFIK